MGRCIPRPGQAFLHGPTGSKGRRQNQTRASGFRDTPEDSNYTHDMCVLIYIYIGLYIYILYIHIFIVFTHMYIYICIHSFFWLINIGNPKILDLWLEMFSSMALFAKLLCGLNFGAGPGSNIQPTSTNYNCFFQNQVLGCLLYTINLGNHHGQHKNFQYYGILRSHISCLDHGTHVQFVLFNLLISMCRKKITTTFDTTSKIYDMTKWLWLISYCDVLIGRNTPSPYLPCIHNNEYLTHTVVYRTSHVENTILMYLFWVCGCSQYPSCTSYF